MGEIQEFYVWSWSSITTAGTSANIWDCKFPICAVPYAYMEDAEIKASIISEIAQYIGWEFKICMQGRYPERGYNDEEPVAPSLSGQFFAQGYRAAYVGFKGDRKNRRELHNFCRMYNATYICDRCVSEFLIISLYFLVLEIM